MSWSAGLCYVSSMGLIRTQISLSNPTNAQYQPLTMDCLVDTGALHLCLPEHIALQLGFAELEKREVTLANGHKVLVPYVGPVEVRFKDRRAFVGAMVMGDEPLMGAIPMEDMDLVVIPATRELVYNPLSPNIPLSTAK